MQTPSLFIGNKNYSAWSLSPWLALKHAAIDFNETMIPLAQPDTERRIRSVSAAGRLPVLQHYGETIWESLAIMEYLAEFDPDLWPKNRQARSVARSISLELHAGFLPLRKRMPMNCRAKKRRVFVDQTLQSDIDRILTIWRETRSRFGEGGPWLFGSFSLADAMYAPIASSFKTYGITMDEPCQDYVEHWFRDPHMQAWVAAAKAECWLIEDLELG